MADKKYLDDIIKTVDKMPEMSLDPIVKEFQDFVERDPTLYMQYTQMFTEVTESTSPMDKPQVQNYRQMFRVVNFIMLYWAPEYNEYEHVGFPINAILNWSMRSVNGYAAFLNVEANARWKLVLDKWGCFLKSKASARVLNTSPNGWFGERAMEAMPNFVVDFECNPEEEHYGFKSWDDFFTRKFREGRRPIAAGNNVIVSACESLPFDLQVNIQAIDDFWIKEQKYSLRHILADDPLTEAFVGGTIYQAFLSPVNYHRWHSPVDGTIVKAYHVPGAYYLATLSVGPDEFSPMKSQGYICQVAARAVMFIQADNPKIGMMCFVAVGMAEVSTCEIRSDLLPSNANPEPRVKKGDELGMFHFGGSTHLLIFRKDVNLEWSPGIEERLLDKKISSYIPINSYIATVK